MCAESVELVIRVVIAARIVSGPSPRLGRVQKTV